MPFRLRSTEPQDYRDIARILSAIDPDPVTPEQVRDWELGFPKDGVQLRLVAVDEQERVVGWAVSSHSPFQKTGKFRLFVATDPPLRNRGIGAALADAAEQFAREHGGRELETDVRETEAFSIRFAEQRGYRRTSHLFESLLDVAAFDASRFDGLVEAVEASGIRLATYAELPGTEQALYEIHKATVPDQPGYSATGYPGREVWAARTIHNNSRFRADTCWVAMDGNRFVGVSRTSWVEPTRTVYTDYTGVHPDYRGRRIALALKLLTVRSALRRGARFMRTNNDSRNAPMLAVNRKLGYQDQPGVYFMGKRM